MTPPDATPYVGLRSFERSDAPRFFGRDFETTELSSLIAANRWVLLYAASGTGKTSLLNAGVADALEERYDLKVLPTGRLRLIAEPTGPPSATPNVFVRNMLINWYSNRQPETLALRTADLPDSSAVQLDRYVRPRSDRGGRSGPAVAMPEDLIGYLQQEPVPPGNEGRVLIIDQLEELLVLHPERHADRRAFLVELAKALRFDDRLRIVLALREDYLAAFERLAPALDESPFTRYRLDLLDDQAALEAVTKPVEAEQTRRFAAGAAEALVEDLLTSSVDLGDGHKVKTRADGVEPVQLQLVCQRLWDALPSDATTITSEQVRTLAAVDDVLEYIYNEAIDNTAERLQIDSRWLRTWIDSHFITVIGTRNSVYETPIETSGMPNEVFQMLREHQLIRSEWRAQATWWELTHDRLVEAIRVGNSEALGGRALTSDDPDIVRATTLLEQASAAEVTGDANVARDAAQRAHAIFSARNHHGGMAQSLLALGHAQASLGQPEAVDTLIEAAQLLDGIHDAAAHGARLDAAVTAANSGDLVRGLHLAEAAFAAAKADDQRGAASAAYILGQIAFYIGDVDLSRTSFMQAAELASALDDELFTARILQNLGAAFAAADPEFASTALGNALEHVASSTPGDDRNRLQAAILVDLARLRAVGGDFETATDLLGEAIQVDPASLTAYELRGLLAWDQGRLDDALADFDLAIGLDDQYIAARAERGQVLAEAGRNEAALRDLDAAIGSLPPDDPLVAYARRSRAEVFAAIGNVDRAMEEVNASIEMRPGNPWAYLTRANIRAQMYERDGALADLHEALTRSDPPLPKRLIETAAQLQKYLATSA